MKRINFIPDSVPRVDATGRLWIRCGLFLLAGLILIGSWYVRAHRQIAALDQKLNVLDQQEQIARAVDEKADAGRRQRLKWSKQEILYDRVRMPVPTTSAMAAVAKLMPPVMGLTSFSLIGEPIDPTLPRSKKKRRSSKNRASPTVGPLRLVLQGVAPNDLSIAEFIGRMDQRPLFVNVELTYSRPVERDTQIAREFQITADIPLDRKVRLEKQRRVSRAD